MQVCDQGRQTTSLDASGTEWLRFVYTTMWCTNTASLVGRAIRWQQALGDPTQGAAIAMLDVGICGLPVCQLAMAERLEPAETQEKLVCSLCQDA